MRLHVAQLGLVLGEAEVAEVCQARTLQDEQPRIGVVGYRRISRIQDEGFVERGILFGGGQRRRHRLDAGNVERAPAIGVHLDGAPTPPAVQGLQAAAQRWTADRLLAGPKGATVRGDAGEGEEDDRNPEAHRGKTRHPGAQTPANGRRDQPPAEQQQDDSRGDEQDGVGRQAEDGVGLRRARHPGVGRAGANWRDQPGDEQQADRPEPLEPPPVAAGVARGERHWARVMTVCRRGGNI